MNAKRALTLCLLILTCLTRIPTAKADVFADIFSLEQTTGIAQGELYGVPFTAQGDFRGLAAVTNGTATYFSSPTIFTPALQQCDALPSLVENNIQIIFAQPVSNLALHIWQLAGNTLTFTTNGAPAPFAVLSSDGGFTVSTNRTQLKGVTGVSNASGTILFSGVFSQLAWTCDGAAPGDAVLLQMSMPVVGDEPPQISVRLSQAELCWFGLPNELYQIQYRTNATAPWNNLGTALPGTGFKQCVQDSIPASEHHRLCRVVLLPSP